VKSTPCRPGRNAVHGTAADRPDAGENRRRAEHGKNGTLYTLLEFIGNPITAMFIAVFVAYYLLGIRQHMGMATMLTHTEHGLALSRTFC
jgi:H+/gluconate symporter-like permease